VVLPFPIWQEAFINDADLETARRAYNALNPQPLKTLTDKISLKTNPADMRIGKSYVNYTEDISLPHHSCHPPTVSKTRFVSTGAGTGSHELCFSNPSRLANALMDAGRD
jgi:hypothetical protein